MAVWRAFVLVLIASVSMAQEQLGAAGEAADAHGFGAYAYDGAGNITRIGNDTFDYDECGRIRSATIANIEQTFTYDRHGNVTRIATTGENDRVVHVNANNQLSGASYDGSGNLLSYHGGTFVYDGLNVVKEFTPTNGNRHLYLYSASNERIATIELLPGGQQESDWTIRDDDGKILRRYKKHANGAWSWQGDSIYRGTQLLAAEVPGPEKVRHFHLDHLGTPRLITGNGGAVIAERTYGAFGRGLIVESTPDPDELAQFTGHERDNFQLDYMHARYYDPMIGRFLSGDPHLEIEQAIREPQQWNRYSYVVNNPLKYVDPDGEDKLAAWLLGPQYADVSTLEAIFSRATISDVDRGRQEFLEDHNRMTGGWSPFPTSKTGLAMTVFFGFGGGRVTDVAEGLTGFGFKSFEAFKRVMGSAGANQQWHHIVEQTTGNAARFGQRALHNTVNLIKISTEKHRLISAHYSSKPAWARGQTVREWLSKKSYKEQYEYGLKVLRDVGVIQ